MIHELSVASEMPPMRYLFRSLAPLAAIATFASAASAQSTSYYTQGFFTGGYAPCSQPAPGAGGPLNASCSGNGLTLNYLSTTGTMIGNGSVASIGQFDLRGSGTAVVPPGLVFFNLIIRQTSPTGGAGTFLGGFSGTVSTATTNSSDLIWTPQSTVSINPTTYQLVFDNVGPADGTGLAIPVNNTRGIDALITTTTATPEPASLALMATGLAGLGGVVSRRRKNAKTDA